MPIVYETPRGFNELSPAPPIDPAEPTWGQTISSAFAMENEVAGAMERSEHIFPNEGLNGFNVRPALEEYDKANKTDFFSRYSDAFLGVESNEEMLYKISKITKENEDRDIISRSGWAGVAASVTAGLMSPLTFVPVVGGATRARQAAKMAAIGFATGVASEAILQGTHETRTAEESLIGIAASTALMGILGGVISPMVKPELREAFEKELEATSASIDFGNATVGGLGADVVARDPGNIAGADVRVVSRAINSTGVFANPLLQNIDQTENITWRQLTALLDDSGIMLEGAQKGISPAEGGTIANRAASTYGGMLTQGVESLQTAYNKYFFAGASPTLFPNTRANIGGMLAKGKLSRGEFNDEVSRAIWGGFQSTHPEVEAVAKELQEKVFGPILKLAQKAGLIAEGVEVVGDKAWLHRMYNTTAIQRKPIAFINKLAAHYAKKLDLKFKGELEKLNAKIKKSDTEVSDAELPANTVAALREKFVNELAIVEATTPDAITALEAQIAEVRALAGQLAKNPASLAAEQFENIKKLAHRVESERGAADLIGYNPNVLTKSKIDLVRKQLLADAKDMENAGGADLKATREIKRELRTRIKNLSRSRAAIGERRAKKLDQIEGIEDKSISAFERVAKKAQVTLKELGKWSDEKLDAELTKLRNQFEAAAQVYDKGEEKLAKLHQEAADDPVLGAVEDRQQIRIERLNAISQKLEHAEDLPREEIRNIVNEGLTFLTDEMAQLNLRRGKRVAALDKEVAKMDPALVEWKIGQMKKRPGQFRAEFAERWEGQGAAGLDLSSGAADFMEHSTQLATILKDKIVGNYNRLSSMDLLAHERTAELQRMVDISSLEIDEFLEKDVEQIMKSYVRTMAPDVELYSKFKSLDWKAIEQPALDEFNKKLKLVDEDPNLSDAQKAKKSDKMQKNYDLYKNNFDALIKRLRHQRGLPADPDGVAYRSAQVVKDLNVLRQMGMVVFASFPDLAQPVMKYGLTRTFRDGFAPLVNNLKAFKLNFREAKLANAANDVATHSRSAAMRDVLDDMSRGSRFEKGVNWTTSKMGLVALFDYWTTGMKAITANVANVKIMDALATFNGAKGIMKEDEAVTYLATLGIEGPQAELLWKEVIENAGGAKVNGVWWPNTESWKDFEAVQIYRQALYREVARTIVQPGLERPLFSDANQLGSMLYQFKSFGMASTPKVMLAGLQQKDAAVLSGSIASLGMGALGYYLWAVASGGKAYEDMMAADLDRWADEAIQRSGLIGPLGEVQRVAQNVPLISDYVSFSGKKSTRRPGDNFVEALLGPSFDFGQTLAGVVTNIHEPTQSTLHEFRKLLPFQNTFLLRQAIDGVEAAAGSNLPERRGQ